MIFSHVLVVFVLMIFWKWKFIRIKKIEKRINDKKKKKFDENNDNQVRIQGLK